MISDAPVCEHCRPIVDALRDDMAKIIDDVMTSDRELVRHYAARHGLLNGSEVQLPSSSPRDLARAVVAILNDAGSGVTEVDMQRLRLRAALLQTSVRGDAA